eukprot:5643427-Prymnesium_polylepis.1
MQCANLSRWAHAISGAKRRLVLAPYGYRDNALPPGGNGCAAGEWPPADSRFFHQFWHWRRCLELVEEDDERRQRSRRFRWLWLRSW